MLILPPRYLKTTPTTFIASIQVQAVIICLDIALAFYWIGISSSFYLETVAPLLCSKHCNGSLISLRIKSQVQGILQGPMWFGHVSLLWPLPWSSLEQSSSGHGLLAIPGAHQPCPALVPFLVPFVFLFFLSCSYSEYLFDSVSHFLQLFTQIVRPQWGSDHWLNYSYLPPQPNSILILLFCISLHYLSILLHTYIIPIFSSFASNVLYHLLFNHILFIIYLSLMEYKLHTGKVLSWSYFLY